MNGPLKAAWGLTAFVVLAGVVLWAVTGSAVFAVFIVLGVVTGVGAWLTGRSLPAAGQPAGQTAGGHHTSGHQTSGHQTSGRDTSGHPTTSEKDTRDDDDR